MQETKFVIKVTKVHYKGKQCYHFFCLHCHLGSTLEVKNSFLLEYTPFGSVWQTSAAKRKSQKLLLIVNMAENIVVYIFTLIEVLAHLHKFMRLP